MSGSYHIGDEVTQYGDHNIGILKNQGPADPQEALRNLAILVQALRDEVPVADRQVIDESMRTINRGNDVEKGTLRRALGNIAGIAAMVGEFGVPVIDSIRKVMSAFGI
jgi:hypothetical protein